MKFSSNSIAEVISIGDELTSGQRLDTNTQWLSQKLNDLGINVGYHTTVADDLDRQTRALQIAANRAELVLITGGLGPTQDDLTREAIANAAGVALVTDQQALAHIESIFARNGRPMSLANKKQALYPVGGSTIHNEEGTAPGVKFCFGQNDESGHQCLLFAAPGVPYEMKKMWTEQIEPEIGGLLDGQSVIRHRVLRCFGIGESSAESKMPHLIARDRSPRVGITASYATISFRITATAETEFDCEKQIEETAGFIRETLGEIVFGDGDVNLQTVTANLLASAGQSVAFVDFQFGGAAALLLRSAGVDKVCPSSIAMDQVQPHQWLDPESDSDSSQHDPDVTLVRAADRIRCMMGTTIGIAIGNLHTGDLDQQHTEYRAAVCFSENQSSVEKFSRAGHSEMRDTRCAKQVVDFLRRCLLNR